jgi:carbon-monoxide dehydrogenase large subunit
LAHEIVRFAGEPVAAVVATSRIAAQTAAEAIAVEYEVLPSVVDPLEATKPGAPAVWAEAPDNIVAAMSYGDAAAVEAAFANAAHKVSLDLVSQRLIPSAMEPRSTIAEIDKKSGRLILHVQSQTPASTRDVLAEAVLKRPKESVRVLVGDIGGGFGQKTNLYPEDGLVAYAATKLGRKIRWRGDRAGRRLSRRGPARGRVHRRAADGCSRPADRHRPTRDSQGELHQTGATALYQCGRPGL